jgi:hypothetical protein
MTNLKSTILSDYYYITRLTVLIALLALDYDGAQCSLSADPYQ